MRRRPPPTDSVARRTRLLLACGRLAGPVFVTTYVSVGRSRPGYRPRSEPVSALALGETGWTQTANFWVTGLLTFGTALGLRRALRPDPGSAAIPGLVAAVGLGFFGAGIFPTDPVPADPSSEQQPLSRTGALHVAAAVPVFVGLPAAAVLAALRSWPAARSTDRGGARRHRAVGGSEAGSVSLAATSALAGVASLVAASLAGSGFAGRRPWVDQAGLWQRVALVSGLGWLALYSERLRRVC